MITFNEHIRVKVTFDISKENLRLLWAMIKESKGNEELYSLANQMENYLTAPTVKDHK